MKKLATNEPFVTAMTSATAIVSGIASSINETLTVRTVRMSNTTNTPT
jgi:hypothetical protein